MAEFLCCFCVCVHTRHMSLIKSFGESRPGPAPDGPITAGLPGSFISLVCFPLARLVSVVGAGTQRSGSNIAARNYADLTAADVYGKQTPPPYISLIGWYCPESQQSLGGREGEGSERGQWGGHVIRGEAVSPEPCVPYHGHHLCCRLSTGPRCGCRGAARLIEPDYPDAVTGGSARTATGLPPSPDTAWPPANV